MRLFTQSFLLLGVTFIFLFWFFSSPSIDKNLNQNASKSVRDSIGKSASTGDLDEGVKNVGNTIVRSSNQVPRKIAADSLNADQAKQEIQSKSNPQWTFQLEEYVSSHSVQMMEGRIDLEANNSVDAGKKILEQYGAALLGADLNQLHQVKVVNDRDGSQVIYEQSIDGILVVGSRVNMMFDSKSSLTFLSSDLVNGRSVQSSKEIKLTLDQAAELSKAAMISELKKQKLVDSSYDIPLSLLRSSGSLIYLLRSGVASLNYRFNLVLPAPVSAEYEAEVDAIEGIVVSVQRKSRN